MFFFVPPRFSRTAVLVLAVLLNVHLGPAPALERRGAPDLKEPDRHAANAPATAAAHKPAKPLPGPVAEMREAILAAAHAGRIEELRVPLDWNELKPDVSETTVDDPIAYWKKLSGDGEGREILAVLANILEMPPAQLPLGKDLENNIVYVWPYLAEVQARCPDAVRAGRLASPRQPRKGQGHAQGQEVDVVAACDRRRRDVAFV